MNGIINQLDGSRIIVDDVCDHCFYVHSCIKQCGSADEIECPTDGVKRRFEHRPSIVYNKKE